MSVLKLCICYWEVWGCTGKTTRTFEVRLLLSLRPAASGLAVAANILQCAWLQVQNLSRVSRHAFWQLSTCLLLDASISLIVCVQVRNTVDTGRTVVCTIHQPSIEIFEVRLAEPMGFFWTDHEACLLSHYGCTATLAPTPHVERLPPIALFKYGEWCWPVGVHASSNTAILLSHRTCNFVRSCDKVIRDCALATRISSINCVSQEQCVVLIACLICSGFCKELCACPDNTA